nr:hypothetical protein [Tanacetum cinerariifolium]
MNQVLNKNERLLEQVINKDIVNIVVNFSMDNASVNVHNCKKCLKLETELLNKKDFIEKETYHKLFIRYTTLKKHCISLEVDTQLNQEIFQKDNSVSNQSASNFDQYFELNELKAQSQEKNTVIRKLKERIKSLSGNMNEDKVKKDIDEIETINIKLDHRVSKLIAQNEKGLIIATLRDELRKLKGKALVDNVVTTHTIAPKMLQIDIEPLAPRSLNNRTTHSDYLRLTQEQAAILREVVEQGKSQNPLNKSLDSVCVDLLTGYRGNNRYTLSLGDMMASSPICLLSKASKTKSWLWHRRLSHLNFGAINHLARHEAVATACYTQNRSILRLRHGKTLYELLHEKLPDLSFFHVFGALCYPTNDSENLGKLQPKADIGPALHKMTPATISSGLVPNPPPSTSFIPPIRNDWGLLFQPIFDELLNPPLSVDPPAPEVIALIAEVVALEPATLTVISNDVEEENHDLDVAHMNNDPFFGISILENVSDASSSSDVIPTVVHTAAFNSELEPKTYKDALTQACWIEALQEELNEFELLEVWELVPRPYKVMAITLKSIYKVKLYELGGILKNKAPLVARGYRQEEGIDFEELKASFSLLKI